MRIMSRVCEGMCGRESFLRFFAASTIAAWQRLRIGREVRGFAGNTSVQKCQTQVCRNAKHKCAQMSNTNQQKYQTQLYRNAKYNYEEVQNIIGVLKRVVLMSHKQ